jgi:hypothetical protein
MGQRGQASGLCTRRACLLVSGATPHGSHTALTHLLHRGTGQSALPLRPRRQRRIDAIPGRLRRPSMPDASMTAQGGQRPATHV